jgi:hypothetical protein
MSLIVVLSVWNEEQMLPGALKSLDHAGVDSVVVFDGAWRGFADPGEWLSSDRTVSIATKWGAHVHQPARPWDSQEEKRTAMFHHCGSAPGDHIFVMDADERVEGRFPARLPGHANVLVKCVGPNDLPGIRGEWPRGDYYPDWKPELRLFRYSHELRCLWPGGYADSDGRIEAYADYQGTSALPVLDGVRFTHHGAERSAERIQRKIRYYEQEHPRRAARQKRMLG